MQTTLVVTLEDGNPEQVPIAEIQGIHSIAGRTIVETARVRYYVREKALVLLTAWVSAQGRPVGASANWQQMLADKRQHFDQLRALLLGDVQAGQLELGVSDAPASLRTAIYHALISARAQARVDALARCGLLPKPGHDDASRVLRGVWLGRARGLLHHLAAQLGVPDAGRAAA